VRPIVPFTFCVTALTHALSSPATMAQQKQSDVTVYTLYRDSPMFKQRHDISQCVYVASFDAADGEEFNRENCVVAAQLLTEHNSAPYPPHFWCEQGRFRP